MASAQTRIADTVEVFFTGTDRTSDGALAANAYKRAVEELDHSVTRELVPSSCSLLSTRVLIVAVLGRTIPNDDYGTSRQAQRTLPNRNRTHQQTKQESKEPFLHQDVPLLIGGSFQLLDYDASRSKLNKTLAKPGDDPTKLPRAQQEHDDAKEVFDVLNDQLIVELPQLLSLRVPYFDPSFEAMIRIQCKFAEEGYEKLSNVQKYFDDTVRDDYAAGQLDAQVEAVLQEMRELSICGAA